MSNSKNLLIIKASKDVCGAELKHIRAIAEMHCMTHKTYVFKGPELLKSNLPKLGKFDYLYLAAHASVTGFGEVDGTAVIHWGDFAESLCTSKCLEPGAILLLACCRGGLRRVAMSLFDGCAQIDYVCGPRWAVTSLDISAGFHVFIYNMESRREQPSCASERASRATGYDFFCYDRVEVEDSDAKAP